MSKEETRVRIGRRLAEIRKSVVWTDGDGNERTGMTQRELAERCGLSQPHITRIENGYYSAGVEKLDDIARAMGYHVDFVKE
jgi:transcriptional regulator with XRE-family HTH domain